jgi:hypothetical protein
VPVGAPHSPLTDEPFIAGKRPISGRPQPNDKIRLKFDRAFSVDFYLFGVCLTPVELKRLISI